MYEEFGSKRVQELRGMFAFAIYDERRRSVPLARDRRTRRRLAKANWNLGQFRAVLVRMADRRECSR